MTEIKRRLIPAALLALIIHGTLFTGLFNKAPEEVPHPLAVKRIAVCLEAKKISQKSPIKAEKLQPIQKKKEVLLPAKPLEKTLSKAPVQKPMVLPENKPRLVDHESMPEKPEQSSHPKHPKTTSLKETQNVTKTSASAQITHKATPLYQINPPPKYPRLARRRGLEGMVLIETLINISGKVTELRLFTSSGHPVLDRAALKAVRSWRFSPANVGGSRQEMWVKVPVRFQLH